MSENDKVAEASRLSSEETRRDASSTAELDYHFFDPHSEIENLSGNLPHWRQESVLYFVTFRSADALPTEKLLQWQTEKDAWLAANPEPWDQATRADFIERFPRRLQVWLDAGHGQCLLARADLREIVESALRHFSGIRYQLDEFVVAANHVHVLVAPTSGYDLTVILHSWKSYTAKEINRAAERRGVYWQQESYDHIVRSEVALHRIRQYIRNHQQQVAEAFRLSSEDTRRDASSTSRP